MEEQEFSFEKALKEGQANAQMVQAYGKGLWNWGKLALSIAIFTLMAASCWARCLLRWKPGVMAVLTRYVPSLIVLNVIAQFYASTPWFEVLRYAQTVLFFAILLHLVMAVVQTFAAQRKPVHSMDAGVAHPLIGWLWRVLLWWDDDPDLTVTLIGEPVLVMLVAVGVYAIEMTVLPAPENRWPISTWVLLVATSMMGETFWSMLVARWRVVKMMDHELDQQELAEVFMDQRAVLHERGAEGVSQVPRVELPESIDSAHGDSPGDTVPTVAAEYTGGLFEQLEDIKAGEARP